MNNDIVDRLRVKDGIYTEFWQQRLMDEAADEIVRLRARVTELEAALRYISSPTMANPGFDALEFAESGARDLDCRMALVTCIRTARAALAAHEAARRENP